MERKCIPPALSSLSAFLSDRCSVTRRGGNHRRVWIVGRVVRGIRSRRENGSFFFEAGTKKIEVTRERDSWDRCRFLVLSGPSRQHRIPLTVSPVLDALADYRYGNILDQPTVSLSRFLSQSNFITTAGNFVYHRRSSILPVWKKKEISWKIFDNLYTTLDLIRACKKRKGSRGTTFKFLSRAMEKTRLRSACEGIQWLRCETRILRTTVTPLLVQEDTSLVVSEPKWSQLQELRQESCSLGVDRPANEPRLANCSRQRFDKFSLHAELSRSRYRGGISWIDNRSCCRSFRN